MLKNCILILPVSDPAKQAAQVVKHHVFDERNVITVPWCLLQINDTSIYSHFSLLLELLAFLDQTQGESKCDS
jgi:hypothetical protein